MSGTVLGPLWINLAVTAAGTLALMLAVFALGVARDRHRVIDAFWGAAFALVAVISVLLSAGHGDPARRALITTLTVVWGLRLSAHIGRRGRGAPEDPRYEALLARAPGSRTWYAFTRVYLLQGALVWFISLPIQVGDYGTAALGGAPLAALAALGSALWLFGFCFEALGDWQLSRFKADPAHRGVLLTGGLRRYTRHPNYFGDACVWWGLFLLGAGQWIGLLTVLSPAVMTWLLTRGSGTPLLDAHLARTRPEYAEYAARTSGFWPRRPGASR
jgi:steroid 5-alpha reductase family enzyme